MMPPLFMLAPPRSFTSLVSTMVGCHPEAHGLPETNLFLAESMLELEDHFQKQPYLRQGLLRGAAELAMGEQTFAAVEAVDYWFSKHMDMPAADVFALLIHWSGDQMMVEKSPAHVYVDGSFERMQKAFPDARYLHMTRHPSDTWRSIVKARDDVKELAQLLTQFEDDEKTERRRKIGANVSDENLKQKWMEPHVNIMEFLKSVPPENQMRLRGEDILADPPTYMRVICEWLDIADDGAAIEQMLHPERSPYACRGPSNARFGNDPNFVREPALRPYTPKLKPLEQAMEQGQADGFDEEVFDLARRLGY